ncbi:hypothetical protein Msi02_23210 [Microbispora siamensis]|uniref:Uncharacterized protein n=1 Tax=Microbispora siamensis TaxID=564413 RepID=A0ABQ4GJ95_9ACTN|nr:hypothetical protein Msi02_23210 [Microbispora siamensis]
MLGSGAGVRVASSAGAVVCATSGADGAGVDAPDAEISTSGSGTAEGLVLGLWLFRVEGTAEGALLGSP